MNKLRKIIVLSVGVAIAGVAILLARQEFNREGLEQGKVMCTDILNNCAKYCTQAIRRGDIK